MPDDLVRSLLGVSRRVVTCGSGDREPLHWSGYPSPLSCLADPHVHWVRGPDSFGPRCGTASLRTWRAWARHGTILLVPA